MFALLPVEKLIKTSLRIVLVAVAAFTLSQFAGSLAVAATIGALVSLPATAIIAGSWLLYYGAMMTTSALSTGAFTTLGIALASIAGGYITLEFHDIFAFGIAEYGLIDPCATHFAPSLLLRLYNLV